MAESQRWSHPTPRRWWDWRDDDETMAYAERGPDQPEPAPKARGVAKHDTLIARPDLGPGTHTFIAAGHPLPT